jgi:heat shock protein HtpX
MYFELHSTHPLTAKRLLALSDQAASLGQPPYVVFDREKPESYWDEFAVDVSVMLLPTVLLLVGVAAGVAGLVFVGQSLLWLFGVAVFLWGAGLLVRYTFTYPRSGFENETVETLLQRVKVSPVRPVPAVLRGEIIGKGVPGLVFSEDFVLRDRTGIIFLDYQQPLWIWNLLFGLLRAGQYQGMEVRVRGWFRRAPVPYLEIDTLELIGGRGPRRCYTSYATLAAAVVLMLLGAVLTVVLAFA